MARIYYVEIEKFKTFSKKIHIDLGQPAVLIGPNNSGKTSVIQALSLWSRGVKSWYEKRGTTSRKESSTKISSGINRLNILDVPVEDTKFLWSGTHANKNGKPIKMTICVGIEFNGKITGVSFIFTYRNSEVIYCKPDNEILHDDKLIQYAANIDFHLLYPMSGIMSNVSADTEETPLPDGRINLLLGQGQTAQVLRNICFKVTEQDETEDTDDWGRINNIMKRIFLVEINKPKPNNIRGSLVMTYREEGTENDFDISLAGRGLQQILLILAYLYWHKSSVLLIDEPDAHLEILRQKQIYALLNAITVENHGQVIIATHSEAILDEAADSNLTLLLKGEAIDLARQQEIKNSLKTYGIEHYYKAKVHPRILYLEGSTDLAILKSLANHIEHKKAINVLDGIINIYYTRNIEPQNTVTNQLDRIDGAFKEPLEHFYALRNIVPSLKGIAVLDSDSSTRKDSSDNQLAVLYWKNYEIENYFITPEVLVNYAANKINEENTGELFQKSNIDLFEKVIDEILLGEDYFNGDTKKLNAYHTGDATLKRMAMERRKMSKFAEDVFERYKKNSLNSISLNKGDFYRLVPYCPVEEISNEVTEKLDMLVKYLE